MTDTTAELRARIAEAIQAVASLVAERDAALADLSALRVAVGQLADQLAGESQAITSRDARGFAYRIAARRLRSLLDDKENN